MIADDVDNADVVGRLPSPSFHRGIYYLTFASSWLNDHVNSTATFILFHSSHNQCWFQSFILWLLLAIMTLMY